MLYFSSISVFANPPRYESRTSMYVYLASLTPSAPHLPFRYLVGKYDES